MKKLKIGNIIKTAWSIYRSRFKEYYRLALTNSFWIFVPVYGWAKYAAMMGLLARLAYGDVAGNSETIVEANRYIKPKTWLFFGAGLIGIIFFYIDLFLVRVIFEISALIFIQHNHSLALNIPFLLAINGLIIYEFSWRMSHSILNELPLAIGQVSNINKSRNIAYTLPKNSIFSLQLTILNFSFNCVFPYFVLQSLIVRILTGTAVHEIVFQLIQLIKSIINSLIFSDSIFIYSTWSDLTLYSSNLSYLILYKEAWFFFGVLFVPGLPSAFILLCVVGSSIFGLLPYSTINVINLTIFTIFILAVGALFIPFWQALKAVAYYQLNLSSENTNRELNYS